MINCKKCKHYKKEGIKHICKITNNVVMGELLPNQQIKKECGMYARKETGMTVQELCDELTVLCHNGLAQTRIKIGSCTISRVINTKDLVSLKIMKGD